MKEDKFAAIGTPLDVMELMEVKGGSSDGDIVCKATPAIACSGSPAIVLCTTGQAIKPSKPDPGEKPDL